MKERPKPWKVLLRIVDMTVRITRTSLKRPFRVLALMALMLLAPELDQRCGSGDTLGDGLDTESKVRINIEALKNDESVVMRAGAAKVLGEIGPDAADSTPALADALLQDKHPMVRVQAAKALGKIGSDSEQGVLALNKALWYDKNLDVCKNAVWALGEIGDNSESTLKVLSAVIKEKDPELGVEAIYALVKLGSSSHTVIYGLCEALLYNESVEIRKNAAYVLGRIGPRARDATPVLAKAMEDEDADVRLYVAEAIGRIGREALEAASALVKAAKDPDMRVRKRAKESLTNLAKNR